MNYKKSCIGVNFCLYLLYNKDEQKTTTKNNIMKTIKLPIQNVVNFNSELRVFNAIVRFAYNRFKDGLSEKDVRASVKQKFEGGCWFQQCAIIEGKSVFNRSGDKKVVFGGKKNREDYLKGLINKDEYKSKRTKPIILQGEKPCFGNRHFNFNFENNVVTYKQSRNNHIEIQLPKLKSKLKSELLSVQELAKEQKAAVTVKFNNQYIWFSFEETTDQYKSYKDLKNNRVLGLDLNPNYIGISVIEFDKNDNFKVLYKKVFDLSLLNIPSGKSSDDEKSIKQTNKRKFELIEICHQISSLVNVWKCKKLAIEDLNIKSSDKKKGKRFNRLCNNAWNRNLVVEKLKMLSVVCCFEIVEVNPAYSSIVGNLLYGSENTPDMVASSIEVARRAYKKYDKGWFYPVFDVDKLNDQWKKILVGVKDWKSAFAEIKKSKLKYRFQLLDHIQNAVFSQFYKKSKTSLYEFL